MKRFYNNRVLTTYFILQPIIDIITGLMKQYFSLSLSLAMIIRFLFIIYCGIYILKNNDKKILTYISVWIIYFLITIVGNYFIKDSFNILKQGYELFRVVYFPIVLLFFYLYMRNHKSIDNKTMTKMGLIVGGSLVISIITNTSFCSYDSVDNCLVKGYLGYFFSANEYGSILIALLGYQMIEFLNKKKLINFITLCLLVLFLALLGTKTSFIGLIGLFSIYILYFAITSLFINKEKRKNTKYVAVLFAILALVGMNIKRLPLYYNLIGQYEYVVELKKNENPEITTSELQQQVTDNMIFNGRSDFVNTNRQIYAASPIFSKVFGLTTQGNYLNGIAINHVNERDFHDLYMFYGIAGLIIELLLPLSLLVKFIRILFKNFKILLNDEVIILGATLSFLLLVSFMAGHSILHPGVSFYLAYIINDLIKKAGKVT